MTKDLEETLDELGPAYRAVADRLRAAREADCGRGTPPRLRRARTLPRMRFAGARRAPALAAASLLVLAALSAVFCRSDRASGARPAIYTVAYVRDAESLGRILASQRADGSWENDFVTRQNAAALRHGDDAETRVAYKKAVRYLRARGLKPLTDEELRARAASAQVSARG